MARTVGLSGCLLLGLLGCACGGDGGTKGAEKSESTASARVFATVATSAEVLVLDPATHERLATVPVGAGPAIILATSDHKKLYTANWADNSVTRIDADTLETKTVPFPGRPYVIALSPDDSRLYVGVNHVNEIHVMDTASDTDVDTFAQPDLPASLIVSPDGKTLYAAYLGNFVSPGHLVALDAATGAVVHPELTVGSTPAWITIGRDGSRVYTLNFLSDDITVVDTQAWTAVKTITPGSGTHAIIGNVTPDGSRLYVTNHGTGDMIAVDTATNEIVQTIKLDGAPVGVNFTPDGSHVWTTDFGTGSVGEPLDIGFTYLISGVYKGTSAGQIREFDVASGDPIGTTVSTKPGATSVVVVPGR